MSGSPFVRSGVLPPTLYHAAPLAALPAIRRNGLRPAHAVFDPGAIIHRDRVFLSRFSHPLQMNLPADRLQAPLAIIAVDTRGLDPSRLHPDDALYAAWADDALSSEELRQLLLHLGVDAAAAADDDELDAWAERLDAAAWPSSPLDGLWVATIDPTFFGAAGTYYAELGEVAYAGVIPPAAIQGIHVW